MSRDKVLQEIYEDKLGAYWHKLLHIKELEKTNDGSFLRLKSITDRNNELSIISNQLNVLEQLSDETLIVPDWYKEVLVKHSLVDKRLELWVK